jgi:type II secretory pathway component PulF
MIWALAAALALTIDLFRRAWGTRRRLDLRADLLDLLAGACRREAALPPLLEAAAQTARPRERRWFEALSARLREGASLPDALLVLPRAVMPRHAVAVLHAADGTSRFAAALEAAASDAVDALALRHRALLAGLYPLILVVGGVALHSLTVASSGGDGPFRYVPLRELDAGVALALVASAAAGILGSRLLSRLRLLPGRKRLASARLLRTSALLVDAGLPAGQALRRAAEVVGHAGVAADVRAAADAVDAGAPAEGLWDPFVLSGADRLRLATAGARLSRVLHDVADAALVRWRARVEALLAWMQPVAIVVVGAVVFVDVRFVVGVIEDARTVRLW